MASSASRLGPSGVPVTFKTVTAQRPIVPQSWYKSEPSVPKLPRMHFNPGSVAGMPMDLLLLHRMDPTSLRLMTPIYDDRSILTLRLKSIRLLILWPGYEYKNFNREIYLTTQGAVGVSCAGELAVAVADTYDAFLKQAVSWEPQGNRREWFLTRESNFEIRDLSLISVYHMGGNVFQAVVEIGLARHAQCPDVPLTTVHAQVPVNDWKAAGLRSARAHPAAKVTGGHKEGQRNIGRSESQKRRAEAIAALVEREKRGKELLDRLRGINIVERDLPGPTGGLMYP
ncbi:hypothetical protein K466DRAFT_660670 [Polyporus arcularius HHB13444]|uniref:Uncharacterized protein n=1 Tax=Polyporus arcularius HHB13444 TaxID=1314778 RepID=A0A5C3PX18_9APHY|nr:hypothetical protein K466DRAFT_660670 [Polyporus arcularius HHB13444]